VSERGALEVGPSPKCCAPGHGQGTCIALIKNRMFKLRRHASHFFCEQFSKPNFQIAPTPIFLCERALRVTLRWLAGGASLAEVCDQFCMAKSTLKKWLRKVIDALYDHLVPEQIIFPTGDELKKTMVDFEKRCSLPLVAGAIDGTFIEMVRPNIDFADRYWCYKNLTGILCLAVVDAVGRFTFVDVGRPASVGDEECF
jgi:hypothetical protein